LLILHLKLFQAKIPDDMGSFKTTTSYAFLEETPFLGLYKIKASGAGYRTLHLGLHTGLEVMVVFRLPLLILRLYQGLIPCWSLYKPCKPLHWIWRFPSWRNQFIIDI